MALGCVLVALGEPVAQQLFPLETNQLEQKRNHFDRMVVENRRHLSRTRD